MVEFLENVVSFILLVWTAIGEAMRLNPRLFEIVQEYPRSGWVILTIAMIGGASLLVGQSVILFVNRVKPNRFVMSLALNGIIFTIGLLVWGFTIWLVGLFLFDDDPQLDVVMRMVALGAAPYAFGFLVLMPYAGNFIGRVISVWSFLVVLAGINFIYPAGFWVALTCVGLGWLLMFLLNSVAGKPIIALRNRLWHRITGSSLDASVQDILLSFVGDQPTHPPSTNKMSKR